MSTADVPLELVSRGRFRELFIAGQCGCEAEEGQEVCALSFVSDGQAPVAEEPRDRPFDLPAVFAEAFAGFDSGTGDTGDDAAVAQPLQAFGGVVRLVRAEPAGPAASRSAPGADRGNAHDQRQECLAVVHVRAGDTDGERQPLCLGQDVEFAALLAPVDRIAPGQRSPFFARTEAASTMAEVQSSSPRAPSSSRTAR